MLKLLDAGPVAADNVLAGRQEAAQNRAGCLEDNKGNVRSVRDVARLHLPVLADRHRRTDDGTEVEDEPGNGNSTTALAFCRVRHHDDALCAPQERGAETEVGAREDDEARVLSVVVAQERRAVQCIARTANSHGPLDAAG